MPETTPAFGYQPDGSYRPCPECFTLPDGGCAAGGHGPKEPSYLDPAKVGDAVVKCPGCGQERWYGYGACGQCGTYLPSEPKPEHPKVVDLLAALEESVNEAREARKRHRDR